MSIALELNNEDIINVCLKNNITIDEEKSHSLFEYVDCDIVEKNALFYDNMEDQIESAYEDIWKMIKDKI